MSRKSSPRRSTCRAARPPPLAPVPVLRRRDLGALPVEAKQTIALMSLSPECVPNIVGSIAYKAQKYPGDIDMNETYLGRGTVRAVAETVARRFQAMARSVRATPSVYLGDFKAGLDKRYALPTGAVVRGRLVRYDAGRLRRAVAALYARGLLSFEEYNIWLRAVLDFPQWGEFKTMLEVFRSKSVVRWTLAELIAGRRVLPHGVVLTLADALTHKTVVKMDLLTLVDGRYTEASNWYILKTRTPSGRLVQMTAGFDTSFKEMLVYDLLTYADRSKHKAMKLAKRLWSYSIHAKDYGTLAVLEPLFQSDAAALNQVLATVETLEMLHTRRYAPKSVLLHQLKVIIATVRGVSSRVLGADDRRDILALLAQITSKVSSATFTTLLEAFSAILRLSVHTYSVAFLESHGLYEHVYKILEHVRL